MLRDHTSLLTLGEGGLALDCCHHNPDPDKCKKMHGWMDGRKPIHRSSYVFYADGAFLNKLEVMSSQLEVICETPPQLGFPTLKLEQMNIP